LGITGGGLAFVFCAFLVGCASPDLPTPRHPVVPTAIADLTARQVGDTVILNFRLPTTSTDQQPLADVPSVEIYRSTPQAGATAPRPDAKNRNTARLTDTIPAEALAQYQKNGHIEFPDKLDANDFVDARGTEVVYTVRTRVSRAKASADSNAFAVRVYPAPATVQDLRATLTETALVLNWSSPSAGASAAKGATFHIYRAEVDPTTAEAAASNPSAAKLITSPILLAETSETEYRDTTFQFGHAYFYTVREVRQFGNSPVESADSPPAILMAKDIFPPAAPQGLETVGVPATNGVPVSVELTWTINSESDLAGYNVYRREEAETTGQKLNSELLLVPTFRDISVAPGKTYFYRVAAVDQSGNQSPLSSAIEANVPGP
jgi:hypothetical protein